MLCVAGYNLAGGPRVALSVIAACFCLGDHEAETESQYLMCMPQLSRNGTMRRRARLLYGNQTPWATASRP